ncbi:DUF1799 domain-containing protein [Pseudomonas cichorii]|nr:DUF1799 domain-containing protein [Pseudomonas cichorii]MBX8534531.1 DUF1799 domain-containing protein [Pseudomonas cichorii]
MNRSDIPDVEFEVWPDVWSAFRLFEALSTQWRVGMGGASGLDYSVVPFTAQMLSIHRRDLPGIFPDLRVMEVEALAVMAENRG